MKQVAVDKVKELEDAILQRASRLATEYNKQAEIGRDTILRETAEKLHLREHREVLLAKSKSERAYRRKVQANELKLHSEMDHLRWNLVEGVRTDLSGQIKAFTEDEQAYLPFLLELITQGMQEIESEQLTVALNRKDLERLRPKWDAFIEPLIALHTPAKQITLSLEPITTLGGVLIQSADNRIRLNNTFEGRIERLESRLYQIIIERLLPGDQSIASG